MSSIDGKLASIARGVEQAAANKTLTIAVTALIMTHNVHANRRAPLLRASVLGVGLEVDFDSRSASLPVLFENQRNLPCWFRAVLLAQ